VLLAGGRHKKPTTSIFGTSSLDFFGPGDLENGEAIASLGAYSDAFARLQTQRGEGHIRGLLKAPFSAFLVTFQLRFSGFCSCKSLSTNGKKLPR